MKKTISILGCGWLGLPLAIKLINRGYSVKGSTTSESKIEKLDANGIQPYVFNLSNRDLELDNFLSSEVLIIAIPPKNIADFKYLIPQIETSKTKKTIFISSTSVYQNINSMVTEESPIKKTPLSEIELLFRNNSNFKTTILRFGGLIGYDRKPGNFFKNGKIINQPEGYVNLIHQDDCIQIIEELIEKEIWNRTLNACADTHPKRKVFYTKEFKKERRKPPIFNEHSSIEYKIVNSEKLKLILNYSFKYPDLMKYEL